jgi:hypothetical protein
MGKTGVAVAMTGCGLIAAASLARLKIGVPLVQIGAVLGILGAVIIVISWLKKRP